jgi:hypothetical protein
MSYSMPDPTNPKALNVGRASIARVRRTPPGLSSPLAHRQQQFQVDAYAPKDSSD